MCPLLAQDPFHSLRLAHDEPPQSRFGDHAAAASSRRYFRIRDAAAFVTTRVAVPLLFCFPGIPARPLQSWCVRDAEIGCVGAG